MPISKEIKERMIKGKSYKESCPTKLEHLRYINLSYIDFQGESKIGELIVHKEVSKEIVDIFQVLYENRYPIYKMQLVSNFYANDFESIEANNTSAFNCRKVAGTKRWSRHSFGKAIDINPIQNPYISKKGKISHIESLKYKNREIQKSDESYKKAMILKDDIVVKQFKSYGWVWGGDWITIKDYQHFDKRQ